MRSWRLPRLVMQSRPTRRASDLRLKIAGDLAGAIIGICPLKRLPVSGVVSHVASVEVALINKSLTLLRLLCLTLAFNNGRVIIGCLPQNTVKNIADCWLYRRNLASHTNLIDKMCPIQIVID